MKRNSLFTKIAALMLCVMMVIGCLPMSAFALDWESDIDIVDKGSVALIVSGVDEADGNNALVIEPGYSKYTYTWTAGANGTLSIEMPMYAIWTYTLESSNESVEKVTGNTEDVPNAYPSIEVLANDVITLTVTAFSGSQTLTRNIYASFEEAPPAVGTEENPMTIVADDGGDVATIGAGETMYFYAEPAGMGWKGIFEVRSLSPFSIQYNGESNDAVAVNPADLSEGYIYNGGSVTVAYFGGNLGDFNITNTGDEADFYVNFITKSGTSDMPAALVVPGSNTAEVEEQTKGYYFVYNEMEDGILTIDMTGLTNWTVTIDGVKKTEADGSKFEISYERYTTLEVIVNTADESAATITFNVEFAGLPYVAEVNGVQYKSVEAALNAATSGQTVTMIADTIKTEGTLIIKPGVTLDVVAFDLHAEYIIGLKGSYLTGSAYHATNDYAKIHVASANISLSSEAVELPKNDATHRIPVRIGDYYVMSAAQIFNPTESANAELGEAKLVFRPNFSGALKSKGLLTDGEGLKDHELAVICVIEYLFNGIEVTAEYYYTAAQTNAALKTSGASDLTFSITGCNGEIANLKFTATIVSDTGVVYSTQEYVYNELIAK